MPMKQTFLKSIDAPAQPPTDETKAGDTPASSADGAASTSDGAAAANLPPSPAKPRLRERCMYGANCYRKNPLHKAEFSHPSDSDWGAGERGVCPYGARCARRHPRHWQLNSHPPGTVPPDQRQQPQGKRQRKKKRYSSDTDSEEDVPDDVIVTGKRARKTRDVQKWSDSDASDEDPFGTDEEDEWKPTDSQYTQDTQDY